MSIDMNASLLWEFTFMEVEAALNQMHPLKSLGLGLLLPTIMAYCENGGM
jgi:hypothetical protein